MPRRDFYHDLVVQALEREGWTITHDPLRLNYGTRRLFVDLGAENVLAAVKGDRWIAVEIKSFVGASDIDELEKAIGQYIVYRDVLAKVDPRRQMYLAIPAFAYSSAFSDELGKLLIEEQKLKLIVFEDNQEDPLRWIP